MATSTIWGAAQSVSHLCRGVRSVSTASHGGLLVAKQYAEKYMPKEILEHTPFEYGSYQFEEDCEMNIPLFFQPKLVVDLVNAFYPRKTPEEKFESLKNHFRYTYRGMQQWFPKYLEQYSWQTEQFKFFAMGILNYDIKQIEELLGA